MKKREEYYNSDDKTMSDATMKVQKLLAEPGMVMFCVVAAVVDAKEEGFNIVTVGHFGDRDDMADPHPIVSLQITEAVGKELRGKGAGMLEMTEALRMAVRGDEGKNNGAK